MPSTDLSSSAGESRFGSKSSFSARSSSSISSSSRKSSSGPHSHSQQGPGVVAWELKAKMAIRGVCCAGSRFVALWNRKEAAVYEMRGLQAEDNFVFRGSRSVVNDRSFFPFFTFPFLCQFPSFFGVGLCRLVGWRFLRPFFFQNMHPT